MFPPGLFAGRTADGRDTAGRREPVLTPPAPIRLDEVGSTNDWLRSRTARFEDGQWVSASRQTSGRGRLGRVWESPAGNLAASCLVRLRRGEGAPTELGFVIALALFDVAGRFVSADRLQLKWPNDVLLDRAKLSGILLEREGDDIIAGVGVNLAAAPVLPGRATIALARAMDAPPPAADEFLDMLAVSFAATRKIWAESGFAVIRQQWIERAHPIGASLVSRQGGQEISGTFAGLAQDGGLMLADGDGQVHVIMAGDVTSGGGDDRCC